MNIKPQLALMIASLCISMTACQSVPPQQPMNPNGYVDPTQRMGVANRAGEVGFYAMNTTLALGGLAVDSVKAVRDEVVGYMDYKNQRQYQNRRNGYNMPPQNRNR